MTIEKIEGNKMRPTKEKIATEKPYAPEELIGTALETPYGTAVLAKAMLDPIKVSFDVRMNRRSKESPIETWFDWPNGIAPIQGESWERYQNRIGDPNFDNQSMRDLSMKKLEERENEPLVKGYKKKNVKKRKIKRKFVDYFKKD